MRHLSFKDAELVAILVLGRKSGGSEVQRHPQVHAELEASLGYLRPCLEFSPQNRPHTSYYVIFIALDNLKFCDKARLLLTEFCLFFLFSFNWSDPCLRFFFFFQHRKENRKLFLIPSQLDQSHLNNMRVVIKKRILTT